jgi:PIN domain nuclease of toxin-antitoxin system
MIEPLLLDTHTWIWFSNDQRKQFNRRTWAAIERACQRDQCCVSVMSVWEVGMLAAKGRFKFKTSIEDWLKLALSAPGLSLVPLSREAAVESSFLPGSFHGDPADRLIVATARYLRARLVTADANILTYGEGKHVNVIEC